jgi:hypothetical protein
VFTSAVFRSAVLLGLCGSVAAGQEVAAATDSLTVAISVDTSRFVAATTPLTVTTSRPLRPDEGELLLLVGGTDVTALSERTTTGLVYRPSIELLPAGTPDVVVYRRAGASWTELARVTLKVLTGTGFRRVSASPQATLGNKGQLASGQDGAPEPDRPTFQDFSLNGSFGTTHEHPSFTIETASNVVGSSRREEALRFGLRQDKAPLVDLSDYRISLKAGGAALTLGHTNFGASRHLVNGFGARGASLTWARGATQLGVATMAANATVGWDQLLPISNGDHRVTAASIAREFVASRPGALRVDATWLNASMLPRNAFTQGAILDAEASQGGSVQLSAATPGQRLRLTTGWSQSRFDNPALDPQLTNADNNPVVAVERETRTARFVETGLVPLQNVTVRGLGAVNATFGFRHERVDPLYRSVVAPVQADRQTEGADANITLGALSAQVGLTRGRDNLASIPTLLTTRDRGRTLNLALPVASFLRIQKRAAWFPTLTAAFNRTQQEGDGVPQGGVFTADQVPNQVSEMQDLGAQWQVGNWRFSVRRNRADQDNRQVGRAAADFLSGSDVASLGWSFGPTGDIALDVGRDFQLARERNERNRTDRVTVNTNLRRGQSTSMVLAFSLLRTTPPAGPRTLNTDQRVELTQPLTVLKDRSGAARGQIFLRFGRTTARLPDFALQATNPLAVVNQRQWTMSSGLNLRLF